jgi:hypothetical protein
LNILHIDLESESIFFPIFSAVSCENGFLGSGNVKDSKYTVRSEIFFLFSNRPIWVSKDPYFYAVLKKLD